MIDEAWTRERIRQAQAADIEAFGDLVQAYQGIVRGTIAMLGVPRSDIEDMAQETFIQAFGAIRKFDCSRDFCAWLRGIARNMVRRHYAKLARAGKLNKITEFLLNQTDSAESRYMQESYLYLMRQCLEKLPQKSAELIRRRYADRVKSPQLGLDLNMNPTAVRMSLSRIRMQLRECVEGQLAMETGAN